MEHHHLTDDAILARAASILETRMIRQGKLTDPRSTVAYLQAKIGGLPYEAFHVIYLDTKHCVIRCETLFSGGVDSAEVHPREVVRRALECGAAAVLFAHNHPSCQVEPSGADRVLTARLQEALRLFDIRVLDHIVVGGVHSTSFAERGWL